MICLFNYSDSKFTVVVFLRRIGQMFICGLRYSTAFYVNKSYGQLSTVEPCKQAVRRKLRRKTKKNRKIFKFCPAIFQPLRQIPSACNRCP